MTPIGPTGSGGAVTAAAIQATFTATGQVFQGTGAGTGALVLPPGYEIGYDQITAAVNIVSTTEATGTTVISCAAHTFDGAPVIVEFYAPRGIVGTNAGGDTLTVSLFEAATQITRLCWLGNGGTTAGQQSTLYGRYRFTPTAAAHTYTVTAFVNSVTGSPSVQAGAGGTAADAPAFCRFTKV